MNYDEALAWLSGQRSITNVYPDYPALDPWNRRKGVAAIDAALTQQAYWVVRAHREGLIPGEGSTRKERGE